MVHRVHPARLVLAASWAAASSHAFAPTALPPTRASALSYQVGTEAFPAAPEAATDGMPQIDDSNHRSLLNNPLGRAVLVDCYVSKCGPCKLIEKSLRQVRALRTNDDMIFAKWDADEKDRSREFMDLMRSHDMTFRKLPTLVLFADGVPVAMRSGMASAGQVERFLEEHLPASAILSAGEDEECVDEVSLEGERFLCEE
ncbi:hypothetical protein ACHAWF_018013 [Thalassiosira exigua]